MENVGFLLFQGLHVLALVALVTLPLLVLVWLIRTLNAMRRNQATMIRLLTSIEAELRAAGDRERWPRRPQ